MAVIGVHTDPMVSMVDERPMDVQQDEEIDSIFDYFAEGLNDEKRKKHTYVPIRALHEIKGHQLDVLVIDYGGLCCMLGAPGLVESYHKFVEKYYDEHPSTMIVFWSDMAVANYVNYMDIELDELDIRYQILVPWKKWKDDTEWRVVFERIKLHLGV